MCSVRGSRGSEQNYVMTSALLYLLLLWCIKEVNGVVLFVYTLCYSWLQCLIFQTLLPELSARFLLKCVDVVSFIGSRFVMTSRSDPTHVITP
jgi:hypothetical protein